MNKLHLVLLFSAAVSFCAAVPQPGNLQGGSAADDEVDDDVVVVGVDDDKSICKDKPLKGQSGYIRPGVPAGFNRAFTFKRGACRPVLFVGQGTNTLNRFPDFATCKRICRPNADDPSEECFGNGCCESADFDPASCQLESGVAGLGRATHDLWTFDSGANRCVQFVWSGQGGNANRFNCRASCEARCLE